MSLAASKVAWAARLEPLTKLVYLCLADYANAEGWAWPSLGQIVDRTGVSRRQVQYELRELELRGLVLRVPGGGRGTASEYRLVFVKSADDAPFHGLKGAHHVEKGRTPRRKRAHTVHPNGKEPSLTPDLSDETPCETSKEAGSRGPERVREMLSELEAKTTTRAKARARARAMKTPDGP